MKNKGLICYTHTYTHTHAHTHINERKHTYIHTYTLTFSYLHTNTHNTPVNRSSCLPKTLLNRNQFVKWIFQYIFFLYANNISSSSCCTSSTDLLTLSHHTSLSSIAHGRSSMLYLVLAQSCCMQVLADHPAFARPCEGVHRNISLMI